MRLESCVRSFLERPSPGSRRSEGDIPFIKVSDMISRGNEIKITRSNNWVSTDDLPRFSKALVPERSVVFAKIG